jgi:hypothetical protein
MPVESITLEECTVEFIKLQNPPINKFQYKSLKSNTNFVFERVTDTDTFKVIEGPNYCINKVLSLEYMVDMFRSHINLNYKVNYI